MIRRLDQQVETYDESQDEFNNNRNPTTTSSKYARWPLYRTKSKDIKTEI